MIPDKIIKGFFLLSLGVADAIIIDFTHGVAFCFNIKYASSKLILKIVHWARPSGIASHTYCAT